MININLLLKMGFKEFNGCLFIYIPTYDIELDGEIDKLMIYNKKEKRFYYEKKPYNFTINEVCELMNIDNDYFNRGFCYFLEGQVKNQFGYKIGSTKNLPRRYTQLKNIIPIPVRIYDYIITKNYKAIEKKFHIFFKDKKIKGEWFVLNDTDKKFINEIKKSLDESISLGIF